MSLARVLYILGVVLIVYAVISGLNLEFNSDFENTSFESSYTFKIGTFIIGLILIFLGRKSQNA